MLRSTSMVKSMWPGVSIRLIQTLPPAAGGGGGGDGDPPLLLLGHPVHDRLAVMDLAHLVGLAAVKEDALRHGGLAGVDVGDDADVADQIEGWAIHGA